MHWKGIIVPCILVLLLSVNIGSTFAGDADVKTISLVGFDGNTLYVGGSGQNNYTLIQAAIDDAVDGDTVFVYDDSSPYDEKIVIGKSINLIGENRNSTIIECEPSGTIIQLYNNYIVISGFTLANGYRGIYMLGCEDINISDNIITSNFDGIFFHDSIDITITNNYIISNENDGIEIAIDTKNTFISRNIISNNERGIKAYSVGPELFSFHFQTNIHIIRNQIHNNTEGVILGTINNLVSENNFQDNIRNARFKGCIKNSWEHNYWGVTEDKSYHIFGRIGIFFKFIPWINVDWHPAQEPYDIN